MIIWMLYSVLVGLIVAVASRAAEWLARLAGYRVRWIWAGALALTVYLSASAARRAMASGTLATAVSTTVDVGAIANVQSSTSWRHAVRVRIENFRRSIDAPLRRTAVTLHRVVSPAVNVYVGALSFVMSMGVALVVIGVGRRFGKARRAWPRVTMQGVDVRVAPRIGPVVVGLVRPEIIVPRWLLARRADEQRLVVTHEDEHVRARDPLLLGLAWGAVVVAPWNPAVWHMLSRLRLAVELDCDARVLRRGAAARSYGSLLIDVAQHASSFRLSALALSDDSSHLHQRILAMKPRTPRFAHARGGLASVLALGGVLVACQATLPTDAEIERMDVATATRTAHELAKAKGIDTAVAYTIDGRTATKSEASALAPSALGGVQIVTSPQGAPTRINVQTKKLASATAAGDSGRGLRRRQGSTGDPVDDALTSPRVANVNAEGHFTGLIFIDGVRSTESQMRLLDRKQIESVEILKGAAAAQAYSDPEAANGVITIKTKRS
jgi:beta-lactamase regulating signal transducer with metallopeptidase domain